MTRPDPYLCTLRRASSPHGRLAPGEWRVVGAAVLDANVRLGSAEPRDVLEALCSNARPLTGARPVSQVSSGCWRVSCARYGADLRAMAEPRPLAEGLPVGPVLLVGALPEDEDALRAL